MAITRGKMSRFLAPGIATVFFNRLAQRPKEFDAWINQRRSTRAYEEDVQFGGLGAFVRKSEGGVYTFDEPIEGTPVRYIHNTFGLGFRVTEELVEDEQYGLINRLTKELAKSASANKEVLAHSVLNNGFNTAFRGFDGLPLFHTAHTRLDGGATVANRAAVDADLSVAALQAAIEIFENTVDDRGLPLNITPKWLVVGPANIWIANEILGSTQSPNDNRNAINVIASKYGIQLVVSHWLTDPDSWFLLADKDEHDLNMFIRVDDQFNADDDPLTGDSINTARHRVSVGFGEFRGTFGSQGA